MESYWHVEVEEKIKNLIFALEPSFFEIFQNEQIWCNLHVNTFP